MKYWNDKITGDRNVVIEPLHPDNLASPGDQYCESATRVNRPPQRLTKLCPMLVQQHLWPI